GPIAVRPCSFCSVSVSMSAPPPPTSTLFPYTTLFRSREARLAQMVATAMEVAPDVAACRARPAPGAQGGCSVVRPWLLTPGCGRSEEHTSELQSREKLVCRLLHEKTKSNQRTHCFAAP